MNAMLRTSVRSVLLGATGAVMSSAVLAADTKTSASDAVAEVVIVTGSYIRGTAEDAALPVDVISSEELEKQGSPSPIDMLKSLTVINGVIGETNRSYSGRGQAQQGSAEINLRGFGSARTLTLLNGKRLASQDANMMPQNAIARVEVLKDGGASTYGSDAIAGVVNFITKERIDGLEVSGDYRYIEDSDGDYTAGVAWGTTWENSDFFIATNYFHRSRLLASDRDWAQRSYAENPEGGWSTGSQPGNFRFTNGTALAAQTPDPGCQFFGGDISTGSCQTQFTDWDYLVEQQDTYQAFTSYNLDFSSTTRLHLEGLFAYTDVPNAGASPTATTTRALTSTVLPAGAFGLTPNPLQNPTRSSLFFVPVNNPGFVGAFAPGAGYVPAGINSVPGPNRGAYITLNQWRPYLTVGQPGYDDGNQLYDFSRMQTRFAAELTGELGSLNWLASATYGEFKYKRRESDIAVGRLELALRGLGGPDCNVAANTPGANGCRWFNPFSNGVKANFDGAANPLYVASADVNDRALLAWLEDDLTASNENSIGEVNLVVGGELPWSLPGGAIGWASGAQYRYSWLESFNSDTTTIATNPCMDTPITGTLTCQPYGESPYDSLATYNPVDVERGVYALFAEFSLPVTDSLNAQLAARFEDYGDQGGSSFDPKLSMKWQVLEALAFRGSVSTTFRAPPQTSLILDERIGFSTFLGASRPVGTVGNPDLEPETSFQWSVGSILNLGKFRAIVDYWSFKIDDLLTVEPLGGGASGGIVNLVFPNGATGANNCATVDPAFLASHFTFAGGACSAANILKVTRRQINGAGLENTGVDVQMDYTFDNVVGGVAVVGASGTWIHKYETETLAIGGVIFETGFDGVGQFNQDTTLYALPEWRAQAYADYSRGKHNVRWTANFVDQYSDQRSIFNVTPGGKVIDSRILHNLTLRTELPWHTTLLATVENVFDKDPPFARLNLNYDPLTGQALGRTFKLGVRVTFD